MPCPVSNTQNVVRINRLNAFIMNEALSGCMRPGGSPTCMELFAWVRNEASQRELMPQFAGSYGLGASGSKLASTSNAPRILSRSPKAAKTVWLWAIPGFICAYVWPAAMLAAATIQKTNMHPNTSMSPAIRLSVTTNTAMIGAGAISPTSCFCPSSQCLQNPASPYRAIAKSD